MRLSSVYVITLLFTVVFLILSINYFSNNLHLVGFSMLDKSSENELKKVIQCYDKPLKFSIKIRGSFYIFHNFIQARTVHKCEESVTFTTIGDYLHLDNLIQIVKRWKGPVSVALHAVGFDFYHTLDSIAYLRNCNSNLFKKFVTFHIVTNYDNLPKLMDKNVPLLRAYKDEFNCSKRPPFLENKRENMYKTQAKIKFPINVLRNVARENAQTHFVLAADIELYPSENIIKTFLDMVVKQKHLFTPDARNVFVLPIFEVKSNQVAPLNKTTLIEMYHNRTAFKFHEQICNQCHEVPKVFEWLKLPIENNLKPFTFVKRKEKFRIWEPFYIDTNFEPVFEERINWENGEDKMSQNYKQCLLDYNYWVLDNAFLVHRPGIKVFNLKHPDTRKESTKFDKDRLKNEYITLFGNVVGC